MRSRPVADPGPCPDARFGRRARARIARDGPARRKLVLPLSAAGAGRRVAPSRTARSVRPVRSRCMRCSASCSWRCPSGCTRSSSVRCSDRSGAPTRGGGSVASKSASLAPRKADPPAASYNRFLSTLSRPTSRALSSAASPSLDEARPPDPSRAPRRRAPHDARTRRRRPRRRPDRARSGAQPRLATTPIGTTATSTICRAFPSRRRWSRWSQAPTATGTCCSAATRTRSARSGTGSATGRRRRRTSSASTRRIRSARWKRVSPILRRTGPRFTRRSACSSSGTSR